ncbi:MAG TPA: hypothetical protein VGN63_11815 [Flavisolibacter sp.]|jgi:hypothetical protein|nr:hypothetical protein [Flavisolibacter sp.]
MNIIDILLWGFAATLLLTTIMAISKPLGLTRMDLPFLLGTLFTSNRNKALLYGFLAHLILGWLFAFIYSLAFKTTGIYAWWFGLAIGLVHGAFVLSAGLQSIAVFHPRMAQPYQGPTPTRQLEPPGFFALNYGRGTPLVTMIAHLIYGGVLGTFYN